MMLHFAHSAFSFHFLQRRVFRLHYEKFYSCNQKVSILFEINSIVYSGIVAWQASGMKFLRIFNFAHFKLSHRRINNECYVVVFCISSRGMSRPLRVKAPKVRARCISFATFAGRRLLRGTAIFE